MIKHKNCLPREWLNRFNVLEFKKTLVCTGFFASLIGSLLMHFAFKLIVLNICKISTHKETLKGETVIDLRIVIYGCNFIESWHQLVFIYYF